MKLAQFRASNVTTNASAMRAWAPNKCECNEVFECRNPTCDDEGCCIEKGRHCKYVPLLINAEFNECCSRCSEGTCKNPLASKKCRKMCEIGCFWKSGYVKNEEGKCVLPEFQVRYY